MSFTKPQRSAASAPTNADRRLAVVDVIDELHAVRTEKEFRHCMDGAMQRVLSHGGLICGIITDVEAAEWKPSKLLLHNYPAEFLQVIRQAQGGYKSDMIARWRNTRAPVLVDAEKCVPGQWNEEWLAAGIKYGLVNAISHGFVDMQGVTATYFCFVGIREPLGARHVYVMDRLIPHLHVALLQALSTDSSAVAPVPDNYAVAQRVPMPERTDVANTMTALSQREREVLGKVAQGKTDSEIATLLNISVATVHAHMRNIIDKLGVSNRTHAAVLALRHGLVT